MSVPEFDPDYVFQHHHATPEKLASYAAIHEAAKQFAIAILDRVPTGDDRKTALRLVREASMVACAGISLDGRLS